MKNTLPVVRGRLTFFVLVVAFLSPLDPTTPGLLSADAPPVDTCLAETRVSTLYGLALRRLAIRSPNQKAATCLAAKLELARVSCGTESACAGAVTTAEASRPAATPPNARVRFKGCSPRSVGGTKYAHTSVKGR